jgi:hypothetical protein
MSESVFPFLHRTEAHSLEEIILVALLTRLKFECTEDEIVWNLSQIVSPAVRKPGKAGAIEKGLPLVVEEL